MNKYVESIKKIGDFLTKAQCKKWLDNKKLRLNFSDF